MTTVESKVVSIRRLDQDIYSTLSSFKNFSPYAQAAKLDGWQAEDDWCRFQVKGLGAAGLRMVHREEFKTIQITGDGGIPFDFNVWVQLTRVAPYETRLRITLKADLNLMMRMMLGSKLQEGIDSMAEQIAAALNR